MWLIAGGAAACAGLTLLGAFWDEGVPRTGFAHAIPDASGHGYYRRDDGMFVDQDGNAVDAATQQRLGLACAELRV